MLITTSTALAFLATFMIQMELIFYPDHIPVYPLSPPRLETDISERTMILSTQFPYSLPLYMNHYCALTWILQCSKDQQSRLPFEKHCNPTKLFCCTTEIPAHIKISCPECIVGIYFPGNIPIYFLNAIQEKNCNHRTARNKKTSYQKFTKKEELSIAHQAIQNRKGQRKKYKNFQTSYR